MKVEVNGKTYCVETLIADNERLRKDVIASADTIRLILDKIRAEIEQINENALNLLMPFDSIDKVYYTKGFIDGLGSALDCIDKYRNGVSE